MNAPTPTSETAAARPSTMAGVAADGVNFADESGAAAPTSVSARLARIGLPWEDLVAWGVSGISHFIILIVLFVTPWLASYVTQERELVVTRATLAEGEGAGLVDRDLPEGPGLSAGLYSGMGLPDLGIERIDPRPPGADEGGTGGADGGGGSLSGLPGFGDPTEPKAGLPIVGIGTGGSDLSEIGLSLGGGGSGPTFFGIGGESGGGGTGGGVAGGGGGGAGGRPARKIVYVVDRSGSMITTFHIVRQEMVRSIGQLKRSHQFHVILFNADEPVENPPNRLVAATELQKREVAQFLESIHPEGGTDPLEALKRAFEVRPDIIYLLTDGVIPEPDRVLSALRNWNSDERVRIHCVAFLAREGQELMQRIAREHHGEFRNITEEDFFRTPK